jgi:hypothetical protein
MKTRTCEISKNGSHSIGVPRHTLGISFLNLFILHSSFFFCFYEAQLILIFQFFISLFFQLHRIFVFNSTSQHFSFSFIRPSSHFYFFLFFSVFMKHNITFILKFPQLFGCFATHLLMIFIFFILINIHTHQHILTWESHMWYNDRSIKQEEWRERDQN